MPNASEIFVKALENEGVEYIFGVPGEENIDFLEAVRRSRIKFILTRHEQGAGFMADVYGRLTGRAGVCLSTLGPGATNLLTPIADAHLDRAPLVAITGQADTLRMHKESHQYVDIVSMFRPTTKWNTRIGRPDMVTEAVRKAFKLAEAEKPGSTHLEFPENVAAEKCGNPQCFEVRKVRRPAPDYKAVNCALDLIKQARKPLILAGNGAIRKRATRQLRTFLEKTGMAVCNTFMSKGAAGVDYRYNLFTIGLQSRDHITCAIEEADLIICLGYDIVEYSPQHWNPNGEKKIIHIDFAPAEVDYWYNPVCEVVGDIASTLWEINERIDDTLPRETGKYALKHRRPILKDIHQYDKSKAFPFKPQKILHDVREVLADEDVLISDVGAHKMWIARMFLVHEPNTCIISNGFASMGIALPGGIAAKLVYPKRRVMTISGDAGFLMNVQELETAVRLKLNTVNMIWSDGTLGLIEWKQKNKFGRAYATRFENPDWVQLARSYGAHGIRVKKGDDLTQVLKKAFRLKGPVVIDCPVDYSENVKLTKRLGKLVCPI
ncbi:MAG TPA: acetolactate synthase large subunit [candidate division Zixibacteria bacterium]|nr:acetolactate synthase large subunit [candidate division Zixibacteria bacterium]